MSHALKELFGQFDWVQRSLILIYVVLEQGTDQLYISPILATCVKHQSHVFIMKCNVLIVTAGDESWTHGAPYGGPE